VEHSPALLRLFSKQDNAGCSDITIRSLDGRPFSVASFQASADVISAPFDPERKATEVVLKPKVDMEKLAQNPRGQISIELTHPECAGIRIAYNVLAEFTVNPAQLVWLPGRPTRREIWVISNYREDFEVESITSQKGSVKLLDQKKIGNRCQLQIEITLPPRQGDEAIATDTIEVKIKDFDPVSIPFQGFYQGGNL
jgi:hypothetical protein